jgi:hypothetical protein
MTTIPTNFGMTPDEKMENLESFLRNETKTNMTNGPWSKLSKSLKIQKVVEYSNAYKKENNISDEQGDLLCSFLKDCIQKNKIQKIKDITYDKTTGQIKKINILSFNKTTGRFTLKNTNMDKKMGTLKRVPTLAESVPPSP